MNHTSHTPHLIVMLTHNDRTVENAPEVFEACKDSDALYWGFKEEPLPLDRMKALYRRMREYGKKTVLEVVAYTEKECLDGAKMAVECGCDYLMGTLYYDSILSLCREKNILYLPFIGTITGRPSVLEGSIDEMVAQAEYCLEKGVHGFDLLGYRYTGDPFALNKEFVSRIGAPVCLAGSVNSWQRLDEVKEAAPWAFTIGGAFFEHRFGPDMRCEINDVCRYMKS